MKVGEVIPVYNAAAFVTQAVELTLAQNGADGLGNRAQRLVEIEVAF